MLLVWEKHDDRAECPALVVARRSAKVLPEEFRADRLKDNAVATIKDVCVLNARTNRVAVLEELCTLVEQGMRLLPLEAEDENLRRSVGLSEAYGVAELVLVVFGRENVETVPAVFSNVVRDLKVLGGEIFTHRLTP